MGKWKEKEIGGEGEGEREVCVCGMGRGVCVCVCLRNHNVISCFTGFKCLSQLCVSVKNLIEPSGRDGVPDKDVAKVPEGIRGQECSA